MTGFGLPYVALSAGIQKAMEAREVQNEAWQACQGAAAILYPGMANAFYMARQLGIPAIMASPFR